MLTKTVMARFVLPILKNTKKIRAADTINTTDIMLLEKLKLPKILLTGFNALPQPESERNKVYYANVIGHCI
jgi:hypothetical protein